MLSVLYSDQEPGPAMVLTVENMLLSCCSSASFVSKGKFSIFSLWFADKFDTEAKDWKPDFADGLMNRCEAFPILFRLKSLFGITFLYNSNWYKGTLMSFDYNHFCVRSRSCSRRNVRAVF